jgi:A/G-specific adenine glycosylase
VNVSRDSSGDAVKLASLELLGKLLGCTFQQPEGVPSYQGCGSDTAEIRVEELSIVGDVAHIFSHVKKTYRVVWTLVTNGGKPPGLSKETKRTKSSGKVVKRAGKQANSEHEKKTQGCSDPDMECTWTSLDEVANAT